MHTELCGVGGNAEIKLNMWKEVNNIKNSRDGVVYKKSKLVITALKGVS